MNRKHTKIVATISDTKCDTDFIQGLIDRGVDVFRLNTAHQTPEISLKVINNIRAVSELVGILIDTKGPEVRTTSISEPLAVEKGDRVTISGGAGEEGASGDRHFRVSYEGFVKEVPENARILIDDGELELIVEGKQSDRLVCTVGNKGVIKNKKSVNVPNVHLSVQALSDKDREYIKFAAEHHVDFIAHSFVRTEQDVLEIQKILDKYDKTVKIIAKIENREGVDNAEEILKVSHGIMVARGDLGIEIPAEEVPSIQKRLITLCIERAKPVITATQMLHSMIENPRPTRAEVSDVANAVIDGTDALMLSGETAYGEYPFEAVEVMAKIAKAAEKDMPELRDHPIVDCKNVVRNFLAKTAIHAAFKLPLQAIIVHTISGRTARIVASYRGKIPTFVKCHNKWVARQLALSYGLYPKLMSFPTSTDELVSSALESLVANDKIGMDDLVLILAASPPHRSNNSNFVEINTVSHCLAERKKQETFCGDDT